MSFGAPIQDLFRILLPLGLSLSSGNVPDVTSGEAVPQSIYQTPPERLQSMDRHAGGTDVLTGLENLLQNHREKLRGKDIGIVTNQTGVDRKGRPIWERIAEVEGANVVVLFSPEHGLLGEAAAGEMVDYHERKGPLPKHFSLVLRNAPDESADDLPETMQLYSLYGDTRKPPPEILKDIDLLIYDIQDVGARFYTYISTLGLVLEAAGETGLPVMLLDRPNPVTGTRIDGPTLDLAYRSFVGFYPIPSQYGLTPGELGRMLVDEHWISSKPPLEVIPLIGWNRESWYDETGLPWVPPSPNIPDLTTAIAYPGMVLLEATNVSEGRGTDHPFLWIGAPWIDGIELSRELNGQNLPGVIFDPIQFTPEHLPGVANHPKYEKILCRGVEVRVADRKTFKSVETGITVLLTLNSLYPDLLEVHWDHLKRLVGTDTVTLGLKENWTHETISRTFEEDLEAFNKLRERYLLY